MSTLITPRMIEACRVLAEAPKDGWTPAAFATRLWPGRGTPRSSEV